MIQLPVLFFSVVVHEFSHGYSALARGDDTAEKSGRLTLNPAAHIDPFGTVFIPLLCFLTSSPMFGWAKPIPVDPTRFKRPLRDMVRVAAMGPLSNIALALCAAILFKLATLTPVFAPEFQKTVLEGLLFAVTLNLFLAFFNLIPIHPLDGSKVLGGLLPKRWRGLYARHVPYGMFIIMLLLFTKQLSAIVVLPMKIVLTIWIKIGLLG